jgi:dephospho-CoA kinase
MIVAGLTGSIAMGKSETARMFREAGVPVFDADAAVHSLYGKGGRAVPLIARRFPAAIVDSAVDRARLSELVIGDVEAFADLEALIHPLVWSEEAEFLHAQRQRGAKLVIVDNPLLFEKQRQHAVDAVIVVSAPSEVQRSRALERPGMTPEKLDAILARQVPDSEKRAKADFVIDSSRGLEYANQQVLKVIATLRDKDA